MRHPSPNSSLLQAAVLLTRGSATDIAPPLGISGSEVGNTDTDTPGLDRMHGAPAKGSRTRDNDEKPPTCAHGTKRLDKRVFFPRKCVVLLVSIAPGPTLRDSSVCWEAGGARFSGNFPLCNRVLFILTIMPVFCGCNGWMPIRPRRATEVALELGS